MMDLTPAELWAFLPRGYLLTVLIETPILLIGLSSTHPISRRVIAGLWLTACTYPIVVLVLPLTVGPSLGYFGYLVIAESFAPLAECLLFRAAYPVPASRSASIQDILVIIAANLGSFVIGLFVH
jgi:hypothetical protein